MSRSIIVKSFVHRQVEAQAAESITPGQRVVWNADGEFAVAGAADYMKLFAIEDELQGKGIDEDYDSGDRVRAQHFSTGDEVLAWLAENENVAIGDYLVPNADGQFQQFTTGDEEDAVGVAKEAVNASGGAARIIVEIV